MPIFSCSTLASGARQLVVQEAFEITVSEAFSVSWLTPNTTVLSTSFSPGAEITTFFAPAVRCAPALALRGEQAGAFEHHVDAELAPGQLGRIAFGADADAVAVDDHVDRHRR
jgi:hypothetical protein